MIIPAPLVRVYFNRWGIEGRIWSVDFGPDSMEFNVGNVRWAAEGTTKDNLAEIDTERKPKAWIEFYNCSVEIDVDKSFISIR